MSAIIRSLKLQFEYLYNINFSCMIVFFQKIFLLFKDIYLHQMRRRKAYLISHNSPNHGDCQLSSTLFQCTRLRFLNYSVFRARN